jgi:ubiquinone/menaquinone biosynthesis C-methylase UbiE
MLAVGVCASAAPSVGRRHLIPCDHEIRPHETAAVGWVPEGEIAMTESAKERVRRQYGAVGDAYVRSPLHAAGDDLARLVEAMRPQPDERLLDVATGGGHVAKAFAPHVAAVVASDLTPQMLAGAERYLTGLGLTNVGFAEADAEALPFDDGAFDLVTCRIAPHHFPHPDRFVNEVARVLKPGGRFGLIDSVVPEGELGALFNRYEIARDASHVRSLTVTEWSGLIAAAGLTLQAVEAFPKRHDFAQWTERALVPPERRGEVAKILLDAGPEAAAAFHLAIEHGRLLAFTDVKALFLAVRPA